MNNRGTFPKQIDALRTRTLKLIEDVHKTATGHKLPKPPRQLEEYYQQLAEETCRVLVVGEAGRGKSTFINALIGSTILPAGLDVETSQAFLVRGGSHHEGYRVCLTNGGKIPIHKEELAYFGSQRFASSHSAVGPEGYVSYIEVDTPSEFWPLPPGIEILDTPGLGGAFAAHAEITQRFLSGAGAAIFVLHAAQPILKSEIAFIESILNETQHIFFIQTRIDAYLPKVWQERKERSEEMLREAFKDRLPDVTIWPFSSIDLIRARQQHDEHYLAASNFRELQAALLNFLARAAGAEHASLALEVARRYIRNSLQTLAMRLGSVQSTSTRGREERYEALRQRKEAFDARWGSDSAAWQDVTERIQGLAQEANLHLELALAPGGRVETSIREKISHLRALQEAKAYIEHIAQEISEAIREEWHQANQSLYQEYIALVRSMLGAATINSAVPPPPDLLPLASDPDTVDESLTNEFFHTSKEALSILNEVGDIVPPEQIPVHGLIAVIAAPLWAAIRIGFARVKIAKKALIDALHKTLQTYRDVLITPKAQEPTQVALYFERLRDTLMSNLRRIAEEKSSDLQNELDLLAEERLRDRKSLEAQEQKLRKYIDEWVALEDQLEGIHTDLAELGVRPAPRPSQEPSRRRKRWKSATPMSLS
jgi:hypothetical protein